MEVLYSSDCTFLNMNHRGFCSILSDVNDSLNSPGFVLRDKKKHAFTLPTRPTGKRRLVGSWHVDEKVNCG